MPYEEIFQSKNQLNETQLSILVSAMYFSTLCFLCELSLALTNTWRFLIKQRKYKSWPLLMFYMLTIWLAVMRIYMSFFYLYINTVHSLCGVLLSALLKLNIGVVQCWILVELALRETL